MALGYDNGTAAWWDVTTGERRAFFDCGDTEAAHAVFSPDRRHFATGGLDGLMTLWDVATRQPRSISRAHRNALHDLLFTPDSRRLLASGTGRSDVMRFWDVETGRDVARCQACRDGTPTSASRRTGTPCSRPASRGRRCSGARPRLKKSRRKNKGRGPAESREKARQEEYPCEAALGLR